LDNKKMGKQELKLTKEEEKFIENVKLASKIVLIEDRKLLEELAIK